MPTFFIVVAAVVGWEPQDGFERKTKTFIFLRGDVLFHKLGEHFWENLFSYALFMTYIYKYM